MGNFKIISFMDLMQCGSPNVATAQQNSCVTQEPQVPSNGVYIQDINGKLWETEDWDGSVKPNAVAVIADEAKFLIALTQAPSTTTISSFSTATLDKYMMAALDSDVAKADYNGAGNTANIMKLPQRTDYAANYCSTYILPDGNTKGYLPSLGQLNLAYQNKEAVNAALSKCGAAMFEDYYWSSTFAGVNGSGRSCWVLRWNGGIVSYDYVSHYYHVRPFADF